MFPFLHASRCSMPLVMLMGIVLGGAAHAETSTKICKGDAKGLAQFEGRYVSKIFFNALKKTRSIPQAYEQEETAPEGPSEILVGANGIQQSFGWHEGVDVPCMEFKGGMPVFGSKTFIRIGASGERTDTSAYMSAVLEGCFQDQTKAKWCFLPGAIQVNGKARKAELVLDMSEMWFQTAIRMDGTEGVGSKFWFFLPAKAGGWEVFEGGWASDGSDEPNWKKPWRTLARLEP